jgi:hypothetical protein
MDCLSTPNSSLLQQKSEPHKTSSRRLGYGESGPDDQRLSRRKARSQMGGSLLSSQMSRENSLSFDLSRWQAITESM